MNLPKANPKWLLEQFYSGNQVMNRNVSAVCVALVLICALAPTHGEDGQVAGGVLPQPGLGDRTCVGTGVPCGTDLDCVPRCEDRDGLECVTGPNDGDSCTVPSDCITGACFLNNRYLTIGAPPTGVEAAIQVTILQMARAPEREGEVWWAGPEVAIPNPPGDPVPGAPLQCTTKPHSQVWSNEMLSLYGAIIMPRDRHSSGGAEEARYEVRFCEPGGVACSPPRLFATGWFADVAGSYHGIGDPNFLDITAEVDKFKDLPNAPSVTLTDLGGLAPFLQPNVPDGKVDFVDIDLSLVAYKAVGFHYAVPACP